MTKAGPINTGRAVAGTADQVFSSLSNGLIIYAVAVVSSTAEFGEISLLLTLLSAAIGVSRGALGTPILLAADNSRSVIRQEGAYALTLVLPASAMVGGVMWAVMVLANGSVSGAASLLIIAATPIVLSQDVLRFVAIAQGKADIAALSDGLWFLGSAGLLIATWLEWSRASAALLIGGWVGLATLALIVLAVGVGVIPKLSGLSGWLRRSWQHRLRYGIESGLEQVSVFVVLAGVAALVNATATGSLRGAFALMAPIAIINSAIPLIVIPESTRQSRKPQQVWKILTRVAACMMVASFAVGVVVHFLPHRLGSLFLGASFDSAQQIVPIIAFEYGVGCWVIATTVYLKTFNKSGAALRLRGFYVALMVLCALGAAAMFQTAFAIALAIAFTTTVVAIIAVTVYTPCNLLRPRRNATSAGRIEPPPGRTTAPAAAGRHRPFSVGLRIPGAADVDGALIALWTFATLALFVPVVYVRFTDMPDNHLWMWAVPIIGITAARFSWLMGTGQRRLFELTFWAFSYAFVGLAPMVQLREMTFPRTVPRIDLAAAGSAAVIVVVGLISFLVGVAIAARRSMNVAVRSAATRQRWTVSQHRVVLLAVFAIAVNIYYLAKSGWIQFLRSRDDLVAVYLSVWGQSSVGVWVQACVYMSLLVALVGLIRVERERRSARALAVVTSPNWSRVNILLIVVIGVLIANSLNPISNARYLSGTAMLAVATAFGAFASQLRYRLGAYLFLASILLIFPLADAFRNSTSAQLKAKTPVESMLSGDYDSFAQIMNGSIVAAREGLHVGWQFFGVILFWVPRSLWSGKPVDTGIYLADSRGYAFTDLSAPLWIELFLNGGWVLLIAGMIVLGYLLYRWDTNIDKELQLYRMPRILGCILPFYLMILLRGSLLQAMSYLFFILAFSYFVRCTRGSRGPEPVPVVDGERHRRDGRVLNATA